MFIPQTVLAQLRGSYLSSVASSTQIAKRRPKTDAAHPRAIRGAAVSLPSACRQPAVGRCPGQFCM